MTLLVVPLIFSALFFAALWVWERRTVVLGWAFMALYMCLAVAVLIQAEVASAPEHGEGANPILLIIALILIIGPVILTAFTPLILTAISLYSGIRLIAREGFSLTNSLALAMGAGFILMPFIPGARTEIPGIGPWWTIVYTYALCIILYFTVFAVGYSIAAVLNLFPRRGGSDYVVVLGSGLIGDRVTPLLAARVDKGIAQYRKSPGSKLIMTGGQGHDELISEGEAMAKYAIARGVPAEDIIIEDRAVNTRQNLLYSWALMDGAMVDGRPVKAAHAPKVIIATTHYHLFRALLLARQLRLPCSGVGSRTKLYFAFNAFIREFIGYIVMTKKRHIITLSICTIIYALLVLEAYFVDLRQFLPGA